MIDKKDQSEVIIVKVVKRSLFILLISITFSVVVSSISFSYFSVNFFLSGFYGFLTFGGVLTSLTILSIKKHRKLTESSRYRKKNLRSAQQKIRKIGYYKFKVRSFSKYWKIDRIHKISNSILKVVKEEPSRYQAAKPFFNDYLDSALLLIEKYALFLQQPVTNDSVQTSLKETERALDNIAEQLEKELMTILSKDQLSLDLELEYVNQTSQTRPQEISIPKAKR